MPRCSCLVRIPNPTGGTDHYSVIARTSREAAQKAMASHPHSVPVDGVITVIADGWSPDDPGADEHNARQPTFWLRAGTIWDSLDPLPHIPDGDTPTNGKLLN